ncbi:hypothetical protein [Shewanella sp. CG12_big_fil_rev_8_21_14_0_65_47_15]|uniref:hypothetical protein n=1 Tax=Shewanella sp. CG12_big_fil_rev_8_21_14_0_65_47_15 TaxID=1975537 RepID=UPI000CAB7ADE|nr:hypothetical protein [Shewanella sp. CG12_big_fil_rev_8_21_14_0_65_47_15]PIW61262.1 MAG: hypothetical protein COW15_08880 [Shewanella sp. CG12_big_fil_rev_8_21_14_0_65_47_15]
MKTLTLPNPTTPAFKPTLVLRFNQLFIFHSLMLLALSLLCQIGLEKINLEAPMVYWSIIQFIPIAVSLSLLLNHRVSRRSLAWLFALWMLLWLVI